MYLDPQLLFQRLITADIFAYERCSYHPNGLEISNVLSAAYKPTQADGVCSYQNAVRYTAQTDVLLVKARDQEYCAGWRQHGSTGTPLQFEVKKLKASITFIQQVAVFNSHQISRADIVTAGENAFS